LWRLPSLGLLLFTTAGGVATQAAQAIPTVPGDLLGPLSLTVALLLAIWGAVKETPWWVPGPMYRERVQQLRDENDQLRTDYENLFNVASGNLSIADKAATTADKAVDVARTVAKPHAPHPPRARGAGE
jgi:hypothetical protein